MRRVIITAVALSFTFLVPAICWSDKCDELKGPQFADQRIDACTKAINSGKWTGKNQAINYSNRGNAWNDKNEYDKAIADYSKAIKLDPKYAHAYYKRGRAWAGKREHTRAIADYSKAIEMKPKYALAYGMRGIAWGKKREYNKAIADFNKTIELAPKAAPIYGARAYTLLQLGRYREALADAQKGVELDPHNKTNNRKVLKLIQKKMAGN